VLLRGWFVLSLPGGPGVPSGRDRRITVQRPPSARFVPLLLALALLLVIPPVPGRLFAQVGTEPSPDSAIVLGPVAATATPVPVSASALGRHASVLDGQRLRAEGVVDVAEALRSVAGVTVVRSGSFGAVSSIFLRGGESDYVRVLLDGVALNQPGGAIDLAGLTMENVDRIEIVRGSASGLYGADAVSGLIHVFTRRGEGGLADSATAFGGSYGRADGTLEFRGGNEAASFGVSPPRYHTDGILAFNNRHLNIVLSGGAEARIGSASTARLTARLEDRVYRFPTDGSGAASTSRAFLRRPRSELRSSGGSATGSSCGPSSRSTMPTQVQRIRSTVRTTVPGSMPSTDLTRCGDSRPTKR